MCGIVGIVGHTPVTPRMVEALKRMEYGGDDSAEVATLEEGRLNSRRAEGGLLERLLKREPLAGTIGIGHTHSPTHSGAHEPDARPHPPDCVAVVCNGTVENLHELRRELEGSGLEPSTGTDTDMIAHLVTAAMRSGCDPAESVRTALLRLRGSFALAFLFSGEDDLLIGACHGSPLAVGHGPGEMYLASDASALAPFADFISYLDDGDTVVIRREGAEVHDATGATVERAIVSSNASVRLVEKANYRHSMDKETNEQSDTGRTLRVPTMPNIVVLGTGMAGFGAAHRLQQARIRPVMYDKNSYYGGHTMSFRYESGFVFDIGPHISFTKDERIQGLFADSVGQLYETIQINLNNYWRGHWPQHPVQLHLHGLPDEVIVKVIADFVEERQKPERPVRNYDDWLVSSFGATFAELFPKQYTRKYHTTTADNMSTDWLGPRIYRPTLEEVLRGTVSASSPNIHYITHFRYPKQGGFVSYLRKFVPFGDIKLDHQVVSINPQARQLEFSNGLRAHYDALISSLPLPDVIRMIKGAPRDVVDASRRLACSSCVLVNIGVDRADLSKAHMSYFYDEDICFTRLSFPHMLSATNAPPGMGNIQAEVYFSDKYKPLSGSPDDWIDPVKRDLLRCGILREGDRVVCSKAMYLPYANIIFDLERADALKIVHGYLDDIGIAYCGRYGDWGYMWTDESFKSGEAAAEAVLSKAAAPQRMQAS